MTAKCLCGGVRIEITGKVGPIVYCHCSRCRKASGTAFGANADVREKYWDVVSGSDLIREFESSPGVWRAFCRNCGSPIYSRRNAAPGVFRLRLGLLEQDPGRRPLAHFWVGSKAPWYAIADALPQFAEGPAEHSEELAAALAIGLRQRPTEGVAFMSVEKKHISPAGLFPTRGFGFTHVVTSAPGVTIHISGQTAWNAERKLVGGDDLRLQAEQALRNLGTALEAAGAAPSDVVFVHVYVVQYRPEHAGVLSPLLEAFFAGGSPPASTWVGVTSLAAPGFLVEIEATAVIAA